MVCIGGSDYANKGWSIICYVSIAISLFCDRVYILFDISRTTCYVTASVALKMELLVQITQLKLKWLFKLLVIINLLVGEVVFLS